MCKPLRQSFILLAALCAVTVPAFADTALTSVPTLVMPPSNDVAFLKKDRSACPTGTVVDNGSPADTLWCKTVSPPVPTPSAAASTVTTGSAVSAASTVKANKSASSVVTTVQSPQAGAKSNETFKSKLFP